MRLELSRVSAGYGGMLAVRDIDLVVPDGSVVALLGPNGAGKTTLLRVASRLLEVRAGHLLVDDREVTRTSPEALARDGVCHITEGRCIVPGLTVQENLRLFCERGNERAGTELAIEAFPRLGQRLTQIAGTMSGGEQQMLALARAYARPASVILLDELSMGLAPMVVDEIFEHLRTLASRGASLLLVEQYAARALELADLVYLLVRGRVAFCGEPFELARTDLFDQYLGQAALS